MIELTLRAMTERDRRFVVPTWACSARYGLTRHEQFRLVDNVLDGGARVIVFATDERTVHAWIATINEALHYAYVAPELRKQGIARRLIHGVFGERGPSVVTHETPVQLAPRARFNPYLLAMPKAA